jgi:hypothetical protein
MADAYTCKLSLGIRGADGVWRETFTVFSDDTWCVTIYFEFFGNHHHNVQSYSIYNEKNLIHAHKVYGSRAVSQALQAAILGAVVVPSALYTVNQWVIRIMESREAIGSETASLVGKLSQLEALEASRSG